MKPVLLGATVTLAMFIASGAFAGLNWDQTTIEVKTGPNDQMAVAHFTYQNTGIAPVRFKSVKPACGCTTVMSQQEQVLPGDKGEITARLNIGDRTGVQEKTITVDTDDSKNPTTVLTIKAIIPEQLEVAPTFLFWQAGEDPKAKVINVKVSKDWKFPVRNIKVNTTSWDFVTKVEKVSKDEFKVEVQPRDTSRSASATLSLEPEDSTRKFPVSVKVIGSGRGDSISGSAGQTSDDILKNPFNDTPPPN